MAIRTDAYTRALIDNLTRDVVAARCALAAETSGSIARDQARIVKHYNAVRAPYKLPALTGEEYGLIPSFTD